MTEPLPIGFCPFKGLEPFTDTQLDQDFFFGRSRDRDIILANIHASPLTVLYGTSGVGKTSLLCASVAPKLRQVERSVTIVHRDWQASDFHRALNKAVLDEVGRAAPKLRSAELVPPLRTVETPNAVLLPDKSRWTLTELESSIDLPLDQFVVACSSHLRGCTFYFVLDQFEEYFLYHADAASTFDADFARAVNRREVDASFLISMRKEELSGLDRLKGRIPHLMSNTLRLANLDYEDAQSVIRGPLALYNERRSPEQAQMEIEDALVKTLLTERVRFDDVGQGGVPPTDGESLAGPTVDLPFLQMVLTRLWHAERAAGSQVIRLTTYRALGGSNGIVRAHLDDAMNRLGDRTDLAADMLKYLVTPSGTKIALRADDLHQFTNRKTAEIQTVLDLLARDDPRVLRPAGSGTDGSRRYEIRHDALAPAVLDWRRRHAFAKQRRRERIGWLVAAGLLLVAALVWTSRSWIRSRARDRAVLSLLRSKSRTPEKRFTDDAPPVAGTIGGSPRGGTYRLAPDTTYQITATCEVGCRSIRLDVVRGDRSTVASDSSTAGEIRDLRFSVPTVDLYSVNVGRADCDAQPCHYAYQLRRALPFDEDVRIRMRTIDSVLKTRGFDTLGARVFGTGLDGRASDAYPIQLASGSRYAVRAICEARCSDLDLRVVADGVKSEIDNGPSDTPALEFTAPRQGSYRLFVDMSRCGKSSDRVRTCRYAYQLYYHP